MSLPDLRLLAEVVDDPVHAADRLVHLREPAVDLLGVLLQLQDVLVRLLARLGGARWRSAWFLLPTSVKTNSGEEYVGGQAFRAPNQGVESIFCRRTAGQRLLQNECFLGRYR